MRYDATLIIEGIELNAYVEFAEAVKLPEGTVLVSPCWGPRSAAKITAIAVNDEADKLEAVLTSAQPAR